MKRTTNGLPSASLDEQSYVSLLEKDTGWAERLETAAHHVASLNDHPGWVALVELLDATHQGIFDRVLHGHNGAHGQVLEQAEYARLHGFLSGLSQYRAAQSAFTVADERRKERNRRAAEQRR